ncbi:uncharacterized protein LOC113780363 [Coffea eugenioides]|uniref:uncharacterized protein LOC113780363 n=1 Tax=Coffea eugenioides TaxID=49369 RepID=UPI000F604DD1|nr:uncharacterized protein LOC113780363 [Coffea eugenioides]
MKFPTLAGVAEVLGDPEVGRACYIATLKGKEKLVAQAAYLEPWEPVEKKETLETDEGLLELPVRRERPDRVVKTGSFLSELTRRALESLLEEYAEIFAWSADDMPKISPELAVHKLHVDPSVRSVKQKKRNFTPERNEVIKEEIGKLLETKIMKEVFYPTWLANPVLVKKDDKAWRMCVDFTDLNKTCPKDYYLLPRIDLYVNSMMGCEIFCFLDVFKGYHQIAMDERDQEKTSFITERDISRLVNKLFKDQIGRNMKVYVDDMLVKSRTQEQFITDLKEIFDVLRSSRIQLNPKKCTFGVRSDKFLGYTISKDGVRANPDKIRAIMDMTPPRNIKEVQRLTGRMAALNRFLLKLTVQGETLFLYLTVGEEAVSAVLIREQDKVQKLVFRTGRSTTLRYTAQLRNTQKAGTKPAELEQAKEAVGRVEAGQAGEVGTMSANVIPTWTLYVDGASNKEECGVEILLISSTGEELAYALRFNFRASNNESEYETLITGMEVTRKLGVESLKIDSDLQLIVNQVLRKYEVKEEPLKKYVAKAYELRSLFKQFTLEQVPWSWNKRAGALSKLDSTSLGILSKEVLVEVGKM